MKLMIRTFAILAAACLVVGMTWFVAGSSASAAGRPSFPERGTLAQGAAGQANPRGEFGRGPGGGEFGGERGGSLFGAFEMVKDLVIIAVIVAIVAPLARMLRRRAPGSTLGDASASPTTPA